MVPTMISVSLDEIMTISPELKGLEQINTQLALPNRVKVKSKIESGPQANILTSELNFPSKFVAYGGASYHSLIVSTRLGFDSEDNDTTVFPSGTTDSLAAYSKRNDSQYKAIVGHKGLILAILCSYNLQRRKNPPPLNRPFIL